MSPFALHPSPDDSTCQILKLSLTVPLPTVLVAAGAVGVLWLKSLEEYLPMNLGSRPYWFLSAGETPGWDDATVRMVRDALAS
ncbi:hypothetical protein Tco_1326877 [Tanacetum coccineum]